jgi:F-type H+-transporting ATPase subunit b
MLNEVSVNTVLYMMLVFLVFATALWFLAIRPMKKTLAERSTLIKKQMDDLERAKVQFEEKTNELQTKMNDLESQKGKILDQVQQDALKQKAEIVAAAKAEANKMVEDAKGRLISERERTVIQLKDQIAELAVRLAGKIAGRQITAQSGEKLLIDQFFAGLK